MAQIGGKILHAAAAPGLSARSEEARSFGFGGGHIRPWSFIRIDLKGRTLACSRYDSVEKFPDMSLHYHTRKELDQLSSSFKVSKLVILRRLADASLLEQGEFEEVWQSEMRRIQKMKDDEVGKSGGNFRNTFPYRVSRTFEKVLISSAAGGETLHREAARLLCLPSVSKMMERGRSLGVVR